MRKHDYFADLDGMRGVLACVVMLFHYGLSTVLKTLTGGIVAGGLWELAVDFFFVLSGFVLAQSFSRRLPRLGNYAVKRIRRLAPLFLVSLAPMLALTYADFTPPVIAANLLMVQSIIGLPSINYPSWSIPFELALPAVAVVAWPLLRRAPLAALCVFGAMAVAGTTALAMGTNLHMWRAGSGLGVGFALYLVRERTVSQPERGGLVLTLFAASFVIIALAQGRPALAFLFPILSAILVFYGANSRTVLSTPVFQALGRWSYGIYLLHVPVAVLTTASFGSAAVEGSIGAKLGMAAATVGLAAFLHRFVEKPLMQRPADDLRTAP